MNRLMMIGPIAALAVAGCGSSSSTQSASAPTTSTPASSVVQKDRVTLDDFAIKPSKTTLKPGKVEFDVTNSGKTAHEFVVIDTAKPASKLGTGSRVPEKGDIGETGNVRPGGSKTLVIHLRKGHYAVICSDPGHYMAGMHRDLSIS
jgi:uncharacterized cupredoxin-like copper-binding protein